MVLSIFLAKLLGIYFLVMAAVFLVRKEEVSRATREIVSSPGLLAFTGIMNILLGLALVIGHPVWEMSWRVIITLLGYLILFQGLTRFAFVDEAKKFTLRALNNGYWILIAVLVVLGSVLTYSGFVLG